MAASSEFVPTSEAHLQKTDQDTVTGPNFLRPGILGRARELAKGIGGAVAVAAAVSSSLPSSPSSPSFPASVTSAPPVSTPAVALPFSSATSLKAESVGQGPSVMDLDPVTTPRSMGIIQGHSRSRSSGHLGISTSSSNTSSAISQGAAAGALKRTHAQIEPSYDHHHQQQQHNQQHNHLFQHQMDRERARATAAAHQLTSTRGAPGRISKFRQPQQPQAQGQQQYPQRPSLPLSLGSAPAVTNPFSVGAATATGAASPATSKAAAGTSGSGSSSTTTPPSSASTSPAGTNANANANAPNRRPNTTGGMGMAPTSSTTVSAASHASPDDDPAAGGASAAGPKPHSATIANSHTTTIRISSPRQHHQRLSIGSSRSNTSVTGGSSSLSSSPPSSSSATSSGPQQLQQLLLPELAAAAAAAAARSDDLSHERNAILRTTSSSSTSTSSSTSSIISTASAASSTSIATALSSLSGASTQHLLQHHGHNHLQQPHQQQQQQPHNNMPVDDTPILSFWGPDPVPLPSRFARIKRNIIAGHEAALEASWARLIHAIRDEVEHIEGLGAHLIPSIEFSDIEDSAQTARFGRDLRRYGVGVVRRAVPKPDADNMVNATVGYLETKRSADVKAPQQDPTCFDFFWTPAQVLARAHPSVLRAQRFMMGLWETTPDDRLVTRLPITYVDRIRIHGAGGAPTDGDGGAGGLPIPPAASAGPTPAQQLEQNPQSADDWITALQSSAGIIAQVDNGSLERWEPDGYGRTGTYSRVFQGDWESHDPWECNSRVSSTMDLYNGYGSCTIFRMFQGVLALSTIEPGMIRLLPSPKLATAYYLLRPFFSARNPAPAVRSGPEWDAYLDPSNWRLERDPDTIIHGAVPGHAQRITEHWHPHLHLRSSMITLPTLQPGDYIFWHPDLAYHISSNAHGMQTPRRRPGEVSMLVYIPAAPLTQTNALYLARQRKAFQRGHPGPDFDSNGRGASGEDPDVRPGEKEIAEIGGPSALQAMGLAPWEAAATRAPTPPPGIDKDREKEKKKHFLEASKLRGTKGITMVDDAETETKSDSSVSSGSHAEAEVVRLSNIILFPDRSMMGYSV